MAEIVNLRRFRKQARKAEAAKIADQNRARHGLAKRGRKRLDAEEKAASTFLDGHLRSPDKV